MWTGAVTVGQHLAEWFFAAAPARYLAAVRIAVGAYALGWLAFTSTELLALGELDPSRFEPVGAIWLLGTGPLDRWVVWGIWGVTFVAAGTVLSGRWYRVAGPVFAVGLLLLTSYQNSWGKLLHTENVLVIHALILAVSPAGDALVIRQRRRRADSYRYGWPLRVMALATVLAYVAAGVSKLRYGGLGWMTAENLQSWVAFDLVRKEIFGDPYLSFIVGTLDHAWPFAAAAVFTVAVELAAPVALLGRRYARAWIVAACLLHASVLVVMAVGFPYQLAGVAFLPVLLAGRRARCGPRRRRDPRQGLQHATGTAAVLDCGERHVCGLGCPLAAPGEPLRYCPTIATHSRQRSRAMPPHRKRFAGQCFIGASSWPQAVWSSPDR